MQMETANSCSSAALNRLSLRQPSCSITPQPSQQSQLWPLRNPIPSLSSQNPILSSHLRALSCTSYRRRYSNPMTFRIHTGFNFNSGDNGNEIEGDDDEDFSGKRQPRRSNDSSWEMGQGYGVVEEFIESVWIFKVFRSYGWMLPAILLSMLLATGPKAFLMAFALPIGQLALTLAFKKLWGRAADNPKSKAKTKKTTASNIELEEEEEEEEESTGTRKETMGYQSWVARDDVSVNKDSQEASTFGGWDEPNRRKEFNVGSLRRSARTGRSGRMRMEKGKFSRRKRKSDTLLLLRLLIAVFPFLGSWTKML